MLNFAERKKQSRLLDLDIDEKSWLVCVSSFGRSRFLSASVCSGNVTLLLSRFCLVRADEQLLPEVVLVFSDADGTQRGTNANVGGSNLSDLGG